MPSEYEKRRLANIQQNHQILKTLGLDQAREKVAAAAVQQEKQLEEKKRWMTKASVTGIERKKRKKENAGTQPSLRRSTRNKGTVSYSGEKVFDESSFTTKVFKQTTKDIVENKKRDEERFMQLLKERMDEARMVFSSSTASSTALSASNLKWKEFAGSRWGNLVYKNKDESVCWKSYVLSRLPQPLAADLCKNCATDDEQIENLKKLQSEMRSPLNLLQEYHTSDVWRLLICCLLMSRVSSRQTKTTCIRRFFELCPTPSGALDVDLAELKNAIGPLGLFESRVKSVIEVSKRFLEMPEFEIGLSKETKVYGIGEFGYDSYLIFCRGMGSAMTPKDLSLRAYCMWLKNSNTGHND